MRNQLVASDATFNLDFGATGIVPTTFTIDVAGGASGETITRGGSFDTSLGTRIALGNGPYAGIPVSDEVGGDFYVVGASGVDNATGTQRIALHLAKQAANVSLTLPPVWDSPTVAVSSTTPYVRPRMLFTQQSGAVLYAFLIEQFGAQPRTMLGYVTTGWLGSQPSVDFSVPDLSALSGWDNGWALAAGVTTSWLLTARGGGPVLELMARFPNPLQHLSTSDGLDLYYTGLTGTFVP